MLIPNMMSATGRMCVAALMWPERHVSLVR
jgi:hypothetical protein